MKYIVFDLEWNQSPHGKSFSNPRMPFEIIEIGAVRLSDDLETEDTFHRLIKPSVYHWIHNSIHDVIHMNYHDLRKGTPFPEAVREFLKWCGDDFVFCTWGNQDVMELQRNMEYYDILRLLTPPIVYYNVQELYGRLFEGEESCRSLEHATDHLQIEKEQVFHRALNDAHFTAEILRRMPVEEIRKYPSLDVYQHPSGRKEEYHLSFPLFDRYVSQEFVSREKAMKDREVTSTRCPVCHKNARRIIRWFSPNGRIYYSVSRCIDHGEVAGVIRIRKGKDERVFADKTIWNISETEMEEIRAKRETMKEKRSGKRYKKGKDTSV